MLDCISNSPAKLLANAIINETTETFWLLSGPSGAGKTTCCAEIITQVRAAGMSVGGLLCPGVFKNGKKVGIDQIDIRTGQRQRLGMRADKARLNTVGCWQMDERVLAWGNTVVARLKAEDLIVIDELGPLELEEGYGYQEALRLLDEKRYRLALVVVRPALLPLAQIRWPQAQVFMLAEDLE
ncbi:MAG: nucleoside-triphosphatase [Anaerolineales bacterium]|jgi:nucleoside-triphosphatase THEP1